MEIAFKITAVILAGVAAYFLWQGNADRAFISAVFGAVSFFLSVRVQVKARLRQRELEREEEWRRAQEEQYLEEEETDEEEDFGTAQTPQLNDISARGRIDNGQRTTDKEQL